MLGMAHLKPRRPCRMAQCLTSSEVHRRCLLAYHAHPLEPHNIQCSIRNSTRSILRSIFAARALILPRLVIHNTLKVHLRPSLPMPMRLISHSIILKLLGKCRCNVLHHKQPIRHRTKITILSIPA